MFQAFVQRTILINAALVCVYASWNMKASLLKPGLFKGTVGQ